MIRPHAQSRAPDEWRRFGLTALARAMAHPRAVAVGEVTRWPDAWKGDAELLRRLAQAPRGRVEGHTAGASTEKISAIAAAGFTSDHEPITAQEVLDRARQGIAVMLRESSLRPDLVGLLDALKTAPALASRLMLTSDGSMPAFLRTHGFVDHLIRIALERGVAPIDAYRMATLNPATYYRLDVDLGGIAPGRYADICLLADLAEPRPSTVIARGRVIATNGRLIGRVAEPPWRARYPVIQLVSAVISRLQERPLQPGDLHAALLDRAGRWVAPGVVAGFAERLDGFATTTSTDFNILALGRRPEAIARAVNRLLELHGGIVLVDGERIVYEMALPLGGIMTRRSVDDAARSEDELRRLLVERGYAHHEPLYSLFFMAADFLPTVRLSPRGVWDVKRSRVLLPSRR